MKFLVSLISFTLLLSNCNDEKNTFWDITKFKIDESALVDSEEIKILYASNGPEQNKDKLFFYHVVVVSVKTGDTINILSTINNNFKESDQYKVYNFLNQNNFDSIENKFDSAQISHSSLLDNSLKTSTISKVVRDTNFDNIADNSYPTIIGFIGTFTPKNE